jgi:hypothetical protein
MTNLHLPPKGNNNLKKAVVIKNVFTPEECRLLVQELIPRAEANYPKKAVGIDLVRGNEWLFERISRTLAEANQAYYNFELTDIRTLNFLMYRPGDSLPWHRDIGSSDKNFLTRKLTLVLFLSDVNDYEGGRLGFIPNLSFDLVQEQGAVILYPSFIVHRVEEVTRGARYIIIASAHGQPFR